MFIARAMCRLTHVTMAVLCCSCSLLCASNSDWATKNEAGRSVSFSGNEEPTGEICHQYSSVVTAIIPKFRGSIRSTWGLGQNMTARGQSIGISIGMLPQTLIMSITVQKTSKYYTTEFDLGEGF